MRLDLVVRRVADLTKSIREVTLARPDDGALPSHPPGSHIIVDCGARQNSYSLTGSGASPQEYTIAVMRSGSGSAYVHGLGEGDPVRTTTPRSSFPPVSNARRHLLVAGGIGVTPMLAHARHAVRWGWDVRLLYAHRPGFGVYVRELEDLLGDRLDRVTDGSAFGTLLGKALVEQPLGTHLYVCGPEPMRARVATEAAAAGWPRERLHEERFVAPQLDAGSRFTVRLSRSGRDVEVPAGTSLLAALEGAGIGVPSMCRQGVCGECLLTVRAGRPLHHDEYLSEEERAAGESIMCCVSRSETELLEIDL